MTQTTIATINSVNIVAFTAEQLIPIRPICRAIGIDSKSQRRRIYEDKVLSRKVVIAPATGIDGRLYKMFCLPVKYILGWLFTIDDKLVAKHAGPVVVRFKKECYDSIYDYFFGPQTKLLEQYRTQIRVLEEFLDLIERESELDRKIKEKKSQIELLREQRLKYEPTLF